MGAASCSGLDHGSCSLALRGEQTAAALKSSVASGLDTASGEQEKRRYVDAGFQLHEMQLKSRNEEFEEKVTKVLREANRQVDMGDGAISEEAARRAAMHVGMLASAKQKDDQEAAELLKKMESLPPEVRGLGKRVLAAVVGRASNAACDLYAQKEAILIGVSSLEDLVDDFGVDVRCLSGRSEHMHKPNQDDFFVAVLADGYRLYGVFDGHGAHGHLVAAEARDVMLRTLVAKTPRGSKHRHPDDRAFALCIQECFRATSKRLVEDSPGLPDPRLSGAAATIVVHDQTSHVLHIGWVGNCRCVVGIVTEQERAEADAQVIGGVLITRTSSFMQQKKKKKKFSHKALTQDHNLDVSAERARVVATGAEFRMGAYRGEKLQALEEIFLPGENWPGIPLTRCVGNLVAQTLGVSCEPEIVSFNTREGGNTRFCVIATDGLWETMSEHHAASVISDIDKEPLSVSTDRLLNRLRKSLAAKPRVNGEEMATDDITLLVAHM